jgi:methylmalonyl-CoA mutase C-terminal domain/subunit
MTAPDGPRPAPHCQEVTPMERKIRVLVAKPGLDGHDRGAKVIARALRDAGMEVIYTGLQQTPQMIVEAALQEDVDVIGLSILSGAHMTLLPKVTQLLKEQQMEDVLVVAGGIISDADAAILKAQHGIAEVFGPGASTQDIIKFIQDHVSVSRE